MKVVKDFLADIRLRMLALGQPWRERLNGLWLAEVLPRYRQLELREQRLVLFAAVVLPLMLLVFAVILPLTDAGKRLSQDVRVLQQQAMEAGQLAELLRQPGHVVSKPTNVLVSVERLARQFQLRKSMTRIRPQPVSAGAVQRLMLQMKDAPYAQVMRFIHALAEQHLGLYSMKIQRGASPGLVHVQAVIEGGRS